MYNQNTVKSYVVMNLGYYNSWVFKIVNHVESQERILKTLTLLLSEKNNTMWYVPFYFLTLS